MKQNKTSNILKMILSYSNYSIRLLIILSTGIFISSVLTIIKPRIISDLTDEGLVQGKYKVILFWCIILVTVSILISINNMIQIRFLVNFSNNFKQKLYQAALDKVLKAPYRYFQQRSSTEVFNTIDKDVDKVSLLVTQSSLAMIQFLFQMVSGIIGIFLLEWRVALIVILLIPIKQIVTLYLAKKKSSVTTKYIHRWQNFSEWFGNQISGIVEIKLWNLYSQKNLEYLKKYEEISKLNYQMGIYDGAENATGTIVNGLLEITVYLLCGLLLCKNQMSIGNVWAFLTYITYISGPLSVFTAFCALRRSQMRFRTAALRSITAACF